MAARLPYKWVLVDCQAGRGTARLGEGGIGAKRGISMRA